MKLYTVGLLLQATTRKTVPSDAVLYRRRVRAESRNGAIEKCLPDLRKLFAQADDGIKVFAVHCGLTLHPYAFAFRLEPIRLTRDGSFVS